VGERFFPEARNEPDKTADPAGRGGAESGGDGTGSGGDRTNTGGRMTPPARGHHNMPEKQPKICRTDAGPLKNPLWPKNCFEIWAVFHHFFGPLGIFQRSHARIGVK